MTSVRRSEERRGRRVFWVVFAAALAPFVATFVALIGTHWHAASDDAVEVLHIKDVGSRHTPLIGPISRLGSHNWHHLGPLMFWALAPFRWVAGDTGIPTGVLILNAAAVGGAMWIARRRGGVALAAIVSIAILLLVRSLGAGVINDPWNPWIAVFPALTYVLLAWSIAERDFAMLPWLVLAGSFAVQSEIAYLPLIVSAATVALVLAFVRQRDEARLDAAALRRGGVIALIVLVALWLAPLIQQLTGHPGNISDIVSYFRHPNERALGLSTGFGIMGRELPLTWIRGNDNSVLGFVIPGRTIGALLFLAVAAVAGVFAWIRRQPSAARFSTLMIAVAGFGIIATARVTGVPGSYLLRWWWIVGALLWCSLAWSLACLVDEETRTRVVATAAGIAAVAIAVFVVWDLMPARVPDQTFSTAVGKLAPETARHITRDRRYLLTGIDSSNFADPVGNGIFLDLDERGYDVAVSADQSPAFGSWRTAQPGHTQGTITVVSSDDVATYQPQPGEKQIASYDPLTSAERDRARTLEAAIRARVDTFHVNDADTGFGRGLLVDKGADARDVAELAALRRRGPGYVVFASP